MDIIKVIFERFFIHPKKLKRGVKLGWKPTYIVPFSGENWTEALDWLRDNATGLWIDKIYEPEYFVGFEKEGDAVAFKLRWT